MATKINPTLDGTFARASQAWLGEPDGMKEFAIDARRVRSKLLVSDPQIAVVTATLDGGNAVPMFVNHAGELHAVKPSGAGLFKSDDAGETWTLVTEAAPFDGNSAGFICWRLSNPGVILCYVSVEASDKRLYYSADDGATWARCVVAGTETPFAFPLIPGFAPDTATGLASFHVSSHHGTTIIGDYSNAAGASTADQGQTIYRTTDGRNIEVVLERPSGVQKHFHAPGYHAGTGRWLIGYGDAGATRTGTIGTRTSDTAAVLALAAGHAVTTAMKLTVTWAGGRRTAMPVTNVSSNNITVSGGTGDVLPAEGTAIGAVSVMFGCLYSEDDGLTWDELWTPMTLDEQPVSFCDFGHPTLILGGSDKSSSLFAWM
jgi:hypothetical protein